MTTTIDDGLKRARSLLASGDALAAAALCRELAEQDAGAAAPRQLLGTALLRGGGDPAEAVRWLEAASRLAPGSAAAQGELARACLRLRRLEQGLEAARRAVALDEAAAAWRLLAAELLTALGRFDAACEELETALERDPRNPELLARLGVLENSRGRFGRAEALLSRVPLPRGRVKGVGADVYALIRHLVDARHNGQLTTERRVLAIRHPRLVPDGYQVLVDWLYANRPAFAGLFELRLLPFEVDEPERYGAVHPWLQDPVQAWSPDVYAYTHELEERLAAGGTRRVNPVARLVGATKSRIPATLARAGLETPRCVAVTDADAFRRDAGGLAFPLMVREDWGHGGQPLRIEDERGLATAPLERFRRPVASEIAAVVGDDGRYRKYRYIACGRWGVSHHLVVTPHWVTRGGDRFYDEAAQTEELAYIGAPDPWHAKFQAVREALGLDFLAFDYGYDRAGRMLVWEANPFSYIHFPRKGSRSSFRIAAIHRTMAAMLAMYLDALELPVPQDVRTMLAVGTRASDELIAGLVNPARERA